MADAELDQIRRAARGDRMAVAGLVARHAPQVLSLATRLLRDAAEAEDVTQEVFIRAWKQLPHWEPRAKFSTWLYTVTLNLCRDRMRRTRETFFAEPPERPDTALSPEASLDQAQRVRSIETAIAALPERQAAALLLCTVHGQSQAEAARAMDISEDALESLLARARRGLKAALMDVDTTRQTP